MFPLDLLVGCAAHSVPTQYDYSAERETIRYDADRNGVPEHVTVLDRGYFTETSVQRLIVTDVYDFDQNGRPELLFVTIYGRRQATDPWTLVATQGLTEGE